MRRVRELFLAGWMVALSGACGSGTNDGAAPEHDAGAGQAGHSGSSDGDGGGARPGCDLTGRWVTQHVTTNTALGATQLATNWNYHRFEQDGTRLRIVESLDCGYTVRGTTDVSLSDAALEAMATKATHAVGTEGTLRPTDDGRGCELAMDRIYTIRGARQPTFLDAIWKIGDPPKELSEFTLPKAAADGMEDWDDDGHEGITQLTGLGDRYTAQLDWHAFSGTLPLSNGALGNGALGGEGVIAAAYDAIQSVSEETPALLRVSSVPSSPGYGQMIRADQLEVVTDGDHPELETCKHVQALAVKAFGDPPKP